MAAEPTAGASRVLDLPQDILDAARITVDDARLELAIALYAQRRLSPGKARELADKPLWEFRQVLTSRGIAADVDADDVAEDIAALAGHDRARLTSAATRRTPVRTTARRSSGPGRAGNHGRAGS